MNPTRILVVDDEPTMVRTVERVLRGAYEIRTTSSPTMALDLAFVFEPHLAIIDVRMPEMDGFELMKSLKEIDEHIRVILMTGGIYDVDEQLIRAVKEDAFYYITKPFDRDVLRALVKRCIQQQELEAANELYVHELEDTLQRLTETQQQLIQAEKMASLGRFSAGIAHEIKNPLNFVNNFSQLLQEMVEELADELEASQQQIPKAVLDNLEEILVDIKFNAERISKHGKRADSIVLSILEHSSTKPGVIQPVNLNELIDDYFNLAYSNFIAQNHGFSATIHKSYADKLTSIDVVPHYIGRAFLNLFNNALYAMNSRIQKGEATYRPAIEITSFQNGSNVKIQIKDNGEGVPEAIKDKIFEPFFTTKPTGTGTGLGLSLSYEIITQGYNGNLSFVSVENEGATFTVALPINVNG